MKKKGGKTLEKVRKEEEIRVACEFYYKIDKEIARMWRVAESNSAFNKSYYG